MPYEEYTVELYNSILNKWIFQSYVAKTYKECLDFIAKNPVKEPHVYSIWCIEYDDDGNEIDYYPMY